MFRTRFLIAGPCLVALVCGCEPGDREFEIVEVRQLPRPAAASAGHPAARAEPSGEQAKPDATRWFEFDLPDGWEMGEPEPMSDVVLRAPGRVVVRVSRLPGNAGGTLANLTRWRGQLGLPAATDAMLAECPRVPLLGGMAERVDLTSADGQQRMLGLMVCGDGGSTFVKMSGDAAAVTTQVTAFDQFAASLRRAVTAAPGVDRSGPLDRGLAWTAPATWLALAPGEFRLAHFQIAAGVHCWISVLAGSGGGTTANLTRWCEQYGKPVLAPDAIARLPRISVLGRPGLLVDLTGTPGTRGMLGVICELEDRSVFVKMDGPSEAVRAHAEAFHAFCASLTLQE